MCWQTKEGIKYLPPTRHRWLPTRPDRWGPQLSSRPRYLQATAPWWPFYRSSSSTCGHQNALVYRKDIKRGIWKIALLHKVLECFYFLSLFIENVRLNTSICCNKQLKQMSPIPSTFFFFYVTFSYIFLSFKFPFFSKHAMTSFEDEQKYKMILKKQNSTSDNIKIPFKKTIKIQQISIKNIKGKKNAFCSLLKENHIVDLVSNSDIGASDPDRCPGWRK